VKHKDSHTGVLCFIELGYAESNEERGRENLGFPGVEILKPRGFKSDPPSGEERVRFLLTRSNKKQGAYTVFLCFRNKLSNCGILSL
jgi:hypothetical protein